ncbi:MAG: 3-hydroxyacyl-ACP dehydratase FabZ [bacterium]|nr:3-hydroxyacyl-ACP dehydratase FabZ [bacterium]
MSEVLDIHKIMQAIPHRYPFLLVDSVEIIEARKKAVGKKMVTFNEPHFQGHFPEKPIMPGVLIIEAMAQTACALMLKEPEMKNKIAYFLTIEEAKFRKMVVPPEELTIEIEVLRAGRVGKVKGVTKLKSMEVASEAVFTFFIADKT